MPPPQFGRLLRAADLQDRFAFSRPIVHAVPMIGNEQSSERNDPLDQNERQVDGSQFH
jgi:hypothetical protein